MSKSKAFVLPSEWGKVAGLKKGRGGHKPTLVKPVTRGEHQEKISARACELSLGLDAQLTVNPQSTARVLLLVIDELKRTELRPLPVDPLRRVALVNEEAGEALQAALDYTRGSADTILDPRHRERMRTELVQTASTAINALAAMVREDETNRPTVAATRISKKR